MKAFEVTITTLSSGPSLRMSLDAAHWMDAWKAAMSELGLPVLDDADVHCEIQGDGSVEVSIHDRHERRFLVSSQPATLSTTQDQPRHDHRASITIEEMRAVKAEQAASGCGQTRRAESTAPPDRTYPAVYGLDGDWDGTVREATSMLASHVAAERVLFLIPNRERSGWRVLCHGGRDHEDLRGRELSSSGPLPGPVNRVSGRRRFAPPTTLTLTAPDGAPLLVTVASALWSTVRMDDDVRAVLLVLNASRAEGFSRSELEAARQVAALVVTGLMDRRAP
jgi:hypothetical protein